MTAAKAFFVRFNSDIWLHHSVAGYKFDVLLFEHTLHSARGTAALRSKKVVNRYGNNGFLHRENLLKIYFKIIVSYFVEIWYTVF